MSDQIEDFVRQNKNSFDDKEPSGKVWKNIETSMNFRPENSLWNSLFLWRAAAVIFMAITAYLLVPKKDLTHAQRTDVVALNEFTDVEEFYTKQISEKVDMISTFKRNEGLNGFTRDFEQLEAMYMVLKEEMKSRPSSKVKDALVLNLLVRIDLLNQQLHKLEEGYKPAEKQEKKTSNV